MKRLSQGFVIQLTHSPAAVRACIVSIVFTLTLAAHATGLATLHELRLRQSFIVELLARAQFETILNHRILLSNRRCLANPRNTSEECALVRQQMSYFPRVVAEARMSLLLGYQDQVIGRDNFSVLNWGLDDLGTYKDRRWSPATLPEIHSAEAIKSRWEREAEAESSRYHRLTQAQRRRMAGLILRSRRVQRLADYKSLTSTILLLQPFASPTVTTANIRSAVDDLVRRSTRELARLREAAVLAERWVAQARSCAETVDYQLAHPTEAMTYGLMPSCIHTPGALADLIDYRAAVDGIIVEFPGFRRALTTISNERTARQISSAFLLAAPTMALCFLAPPIVSVPVGAIAGGLSLLASQQDYNRVRDRELGRMVDLNQEVDWEELKSAQLGRNLDVLLLPMFGGVHSAGAITRSAPVRSYLSSLARLKQLVLRWP